MLTLRLAFRRDTPGDEFIVSADTECALLPFARAAETIYDHEDSFLRRLVAANLAPQSMQNLIAAVILAVAQPRRDQEWVPVDVTEEQVSILGLNLSPAAGLPAGLPFSFQQNAYLFHNFLLNSPTPFVMLSGPEYVITFINQPYVRILGRTSPEQLLGRSALEAVPELAGQPCLRLLDSAYRSGVVQRRVELKSVFREDGTGLDVEVYFDIVYNPVHDEFGHVIGVMAQATDVTERVLARQVTEHREQQMYRLWAELETLYKAAPPVGIAVIQASDRKLLRMNRRLAELLRAPAENLIGYPVASLPSVTPLMGELLEAAVAEVQPNRTVEVMLPYEPPWKISLIPTLDVHGRVETITVVAEAAVVAAEPEPALAATL